VLVGLWRKWLKTTFRADLLFRYGGDEFLVVMRKRSEEQAEIAVRRLLASVEVGTSPAARVRMQIPMGITPARSPWLGNHLRRAARSRPEGCTAETQDWWLV